MNAALTDHQRTRDKEMVTRAHLFYFKRLNLLKSKIIRFSQNKRIKNIKTTKKVVKRILKMTNKSLKQLNQPFKIGVTFRPHHYMCT
jgi:hypothetical protein